MIHYSSSHYRTNSQKSFFFKWINRKMQENHAKLQFFLSNMLQNVVKTDKQQIVMVTFRKYGKYFLKSFDFSLCTRFSIFTLFPFVIHFNKTINLKE